MWWERYSAEILRLIAVLFDYVAVVGAVVTAYWLRRYLPVIGDSSFFIPPLYLYAIVPLIFLCFLYAIGARVRNIPFWIMLQKVFWAVVYSIVTIAMLMYLAQVGAVVSRLFVLTTGCLAVVYLWGARFMLRRYVSTRELFRVPVVFIGAGLTAERVVHSLDYNQGFSYRIVGFLDDAPVSARLAEEYGILGGFDDAEDVIKKTKVREVIITAPGLTSERQIQLINRIQPLVDRLITVPDLIGVPMGNLSATSLISERIILLNIGNNLRRRRNRFVKRLFDLILSIVGTICISPLLLLLAIMIFLEDKGAPIFAHRRIGRDGKEFPCYKFRSMVVDSKERLEKYLADNPEAREEWEREFKLKDDPRVTKIGAFLRRSSLDELPQLFNVIKGEMSLVGPRPIVRDEIVKYGEFIEDFYLVPPGMTGLWQISGRSDTTYEERVQMDSWYVRNWSIWLDIFYLFKTVQVVLRGKGAY